MCTVLFFMIDTNPLDNFTTYLKNVYPNTKLHHVFFEPNHKRCSSPFNVCKCSARECCITGLPWKIGKLSTIDIEKSSYRQSNLSGVPQPKVSSKPA